jgi:hypothetical protein
VTLEVVVETKVPIVVLNPVHTKTIPFVLREFLAFFEFLPKLIQTIVTVVVLFLAKSDPRLEDVLELIEQFSPVPVRFTLESSP